MLRESDSRFVIDRIRAFDSEHCLPVNYCGLVAGNFDPQERCWRVMLCDQLTGREFGAKARHVFNCGGVWTDEINGLLGLESHYRHVFSKGVYLALPPCGEEERRCATIYPMPGASDVLTHVPWGPVMMWGPTETAVRDLEPALSPDREDLQFLLSSASQCLSRRVGAEEVISVRCGVRPLAVRKDYAGNDYPLELSRRHRIFADKERQAVAVYGGKLTSGLTLAEEVAQILKQWGEPRYPKPSPRACEEAPVTSRHPTLHQDFVTARWSRDHEFCVSLEDYLRRRTPLAQWIPRMGLGRSSEHRPSLEQLATVFAAEGQTATSLVDTYEKKIHATYDSLLASL